MYLKRVSKRKDSSFQILKSLRNYTLLFISSFLLLTIPVNTVSAEPTTDQQQTVRISGTVTDSSGEALIGATVNEKGTNNSTITDVKGEFQLTLSRSVNPVLVVTYIGFERKEVTVGNQKNLSIELAASSESLSEVVVTGLGQTREMKSLGFAISSLKTEDLTKAGNSVNPFTTLYGKAAGVGIQMGSAGPTGGINIKIRGANRLEASSNIRPLFVVDGVPIRDDGSSMASRGYDPMNSFDYGSGINDLNAEDIESMEILKGAKASVLYGSEGANGVVLITTKKGTNVQGLGVTVSYQSSYEKPVSYIKFQNEYGSGTDEYSLATNGDKIVNSKYNFGPRFDGHTITYWDGSQRPYQAYPNNYMDIFNAGNTGSLNVAIAGGNEKGNMRLSYTNYDYNGIMPNYWQQKNNFSFAGKMNASNFASFEVVTNLYNISTHNRLPNLFRLVSDGSNRDYDYQTIAKMYLDDDGYSRRNMEQYGLPSFQTNIADLLWQQNRNSNLDKKTHLITSLKGTFKFFPYLFLTTNAGLDYTQIDFERNNQVTALQPKVTGGLYRFETNQHVVQNFEGLLNFDKSFLEDQLRITAFAGGAYKYTSDYAIYVATYGDMSYPDWYSLNNAPNWPSSGDRGKVMGNSSDNSSRGSDVKYSVIGAATLSWKEKYWIDFNARNDWTSLLPPQNNSYFYPGISFTWLFTEDFKVPSMNSGKLRLAWADTGSPGSSLDRYFAINSYSVSTIPGTNGAQTVSPPNSLFSGILKPERKREFEVGFNGLFFPKNRLNLDFTFYTGNVYNQIMSVPLSTTTGYSTIKMNAGNVRNWGYELFLKGDIITGKNFNWNATFTLANQFSKVVQLYSGITRKVIQSNNGWQVVADEGERTGNLLTYDYLRAPNGQKIVNSDGLYSLDYTKGFQKTANVNPNVIGGFSTEFNYKNFNLYLGLDYSFGSSIISMSNYYLAGYGQTKETLAGRDEAHGGKPYYYNSSGSLVPLQSGQTTPNGEKIYHNGIILPGVKQTADGQFVPNDQMVSNTAYWQTFIHDMQDNLQPDYISKNNYIKMREIALRYTLPKKISMKALLQRLSLSVYTRNPFYIYKSIPNVDAESILGTDSYQEYTAFPSVRSFGFGVSVAF